MERIKSDLEESGMATGPVAYELVEGQSVTLHVPFMPSIPF